MYDVLDICGYVINYSNLNSNSISNLKLQKILYFIQAQFLVDTNKPCFKEKIEAWNFGPVVPEAYHAFKQFGASNIPSISTYLEYDRNNLWTARTKTFDRNIISRKDRTRIENVINIFSEYSATELVELTHNQSPWQEAYHLGENREITIESIRRYFDE